MALSELANLALSSLRSNLAADPPQGIRPEDIDSFFARHGESLAAVLTEKIAEHETRMLLESAGLKAVPGMSEPDQLRLFQTFRNSVQYGAEPEPDPDARHVKAVALAESIKRALLRQQTTFQSHEPGQTGYSDVRSAPSRLPIRRWFRENAKVLFAYADKAFQEPIKSERRRIRLLRDMRPVIAGQTTLPRGSVWEIEAESRAGGFLYGWEIRPPGQGIHVIPKDEATVSSDAADGGQAKDMESYQSWRIFSDDAGVLWAVNGASTLSASGMLELHELIDEFNLRWR